MTDEEITDENYCDWRQSNCPLVKDYRARIVELESALKQMLELADEEFLWDYPQVYAARAAYLGEKE